MASKAFTLYACLVIISMDLHPIRPVKFDRLVEFDWALITGQIG